MFCFFKLHVLPCTADRFYASRREQLSGQKLDFKRDLRIEFGHYIQARVLSIVKNSMASRTNCCIALALVENI